MNPEIQDVEIKSLETHQDGRGFFREILRVTDPICNAGFGQLSHSLVNTGILKAWHGHKFQTQTNNVTSGLLRVVLFDNRPDSCTFRNRMEFFCGEGQPAKCYMFPPGILHGYKCLSGPMNIIYMTSGTYDLNDEIRFSPDDPAISFDWTSGSEKK